METSAKERTIIKLCAVSSIALFFGHSAIRTAQEILRQPEDFLWCFDGAAIFKALKMAS